ncbi:hypothetical protein COU78_04760 [Candidatus Peregrinibacteria bacterium CG10_big_fil_rev_8_21_14_0_10_49_24]|nr:MAG: hypothetical protein COV83_03905 [Candidatus Peregrinibacteria bacterium CG11_big_fil_rev_8_21_14_0_20_49_14]PIR50662.1 MAG: hypothetical protein COU78_04760 [Candidatus Peregrinibacteria bacterium CG10_big_fil_rev_8_21_14_0_10_49_24]PJA67746.1 MAG: hypothetical protein CO157_03050 [Candidatus Peregrinibacteria bacterium CG_4_9_14_3_um_filter_49_12]
MVKKFSTNALKSKQLEEQDSRYAENHEYDYIIIGTGNAALTVGALLANAGKKICMLEAHDTPGGYAHTFHMGDFHFCAQVHYIWGAGPGGRVHAFLKKIGLEKDITFELMGPEGYDLMSLPDGKKVFIPYGWDKLSENIEKEYPGQKQAVDTFTNLLSKMRTEFNRIPDKKLTLWDYMTKWYRVRTLLRYRNKTVQDVFDECGLSKESQLILIANAGDLMEPPESLSIFAYAGLFGGYNTGSYYPTKHFKYYIGRIADFITEHEGCHIYYETEVSKIHTDGNTVRSVETKDGKTFTAPNYICNMDPQKASHMIGWDKFPKEDRKKLSYEYSPAGIVVYLGLKDDIDLRDFGFGSYNIWHNEQWDMNTMWKEMSECNFDNPWIFMSTPTLHTNDESNSPKGHQILEIASYTEYQPLKEAQEKGYADYDRLKDKIAGRMIEIVEERFIPNLRNHITVKVVGSSVTNEDFCLSPFGNAYGSRLTPSYYTTDRLKADTPFTNLHWCNASSGWAGIYGTVLTGSGLYSKLTGDKFYDPTTAPTDDEMIAEVQTRLKRESAEPTLNT